MTALIIDTLSIQPYIFGSNKLKENIGGSYIIEHLVYGKMIPLALDDSKVCSDIDLNEWVEAPTTYKLIGDQSARVEIGYLGGGNAFLIFRELTDAKAFVGAYSKRLLEYFPGLKTAIGLHEFNYEEGEAYTLFRRNLNETLVQNRHLQATQTLPFKHGIVDDCPWTNEAQETVIREKETDLSISQMAKSRIAVVGNAKDELIQKFGSIIGPDFTFSDELEKLGQPDDKGYIAIVHADGNGMGIRFAGCKSLAETRELSANVKSYADTVMAGLIRYIVEKKDALHEEEWETEKDKKVLPIRPLILGGDDITFVCEGRLGFHLAEKLLNLMTTTPIGGDKISACAGIAVVHTKSPFYKAYQLTDQLTQKAKDASRAKSDSWLHYMVCTGGFSGSYDSILKDQYTLSDGRILKAGPYQLNGESLSNLKSGMKAFQKPATNGGWPRNKQMELRDTLKKDEASINYFLQEIKARGLVLPNGLKNLWNETETPLYDMIELLDFYPKELI